MVALERSSSANPVKKVKGSELRLQLKTQTAAVAAYQRYPSHSLGRSEVGGVAEGGKGKLPLEAEQVLSDALEVLPDLSQAVLQPFLGGSRSRQKVAQVTQIK